MVIWRMLALKVYNEWPINPANIETVIRAIHKTGTDRIMYYTHIWPYDHVVCPYMVICQCITLIHAHMSLSQVIRANHKTGTDTERHLSSIRRPSDTHLQQI